MKIYEEITKEKAKLACSEFQEDSYLSLEWSYVISLPIWVPLSLLAVIFILFFPKSLFKPFINFVRKIFQTSQRKSIDTNTYAQMMTTADKESIPMMKMPTSSIARNDNNTNEIIKDRRVPMARTHQNILNIHKVNDMVKVIEYHKRDPTNELHEISSIICKSNDYSEAFEYLCTCLPGNRILPRKPIRL